MGAMLGLFGGICLAVGLAIIDTSAKTPEEIEKRLNLPILGIVPKLDRGRGLMQINSKKTPFEFMAHEFPLSPFTDAIRIVQNTVSSCMSSDSGCCAMLCVSSALPLEGKTLISIVMATVIASERKKVLLVDCDLRRPRIHEVFNTELSGPGLSDLITGKCIDIKNADPEIPRSRAVLHDLGDHTGKPCPDAQNQDPSTDF